MLSSAIEFNGSWGKYKNIAGVDEVGRGPLAGPVVAAAVILNPDARIEGLDDSKKMSERKREKLFDEIHQCSIAVAIGRADVNEIDEINILQASLLAMQRAVANLSIRTDFVLVDGNRCPNLPCPSAAIIKGDSIIDGIAAASIIAKVTRDNEMKKLDLDYPQYGFSKHKGYPTKAHISAITEHGVTDLHRKSFGPVKKVIEENLLVAE